MMLWRHHDLFWQECLHIYLVNWAESVTLSGDAKVDTLVPPFGEGEMVAPGAYHDIYVGNNSEYTQIHDQYPYIGMSTYLYIIFPESNFNLCTDTSVLL